MRSLWMWEESVQARMLMLMIYLMPSNTPFCPMSEWRRPSPRISIWRMAREDEYKRYGFLPNGQTDVAKINAATVSALDFWELAPGWVGDGPHAYMEPATDFTQIGRRS